jgi:type IV pilus assembly protein PilM
VAVINLGDETIDIVIGQNETFKFTRPLNVGGRSITAGIAEDLGIEFDKAEEVKHDPDKTWLSDPIVTTGTDGDVESQTISAMKDIVEQIKRTFAYFSSVPGGGQVDRIVLTGGGSTNAEISNYLYENLGLSVDIVDIFGDLNIESSEVNDFSNSSAVLGLALQGVNGVPLKINLLPESITTPQKSTNQVLKELVGTLIDLIVPDGDDS